MPQEIKRRTAKVRVFPSRDALLRLVSAVLPGALRGMKREGELWCFTRHRRGRWLNNRVEQDHRRIKRRTRPMPGSSGS